MKTLLKFASLFFAGTLPSALAAEFIGVDLPTGLDTATAFGAFVVSFVALIAFTDYTRNVGPLTDRFAKRNVSPKAVHPLAA